MGRFNRLHVEAGIFHITHRCHNKAYLLKFAKDRHAYRRILREGLSEFKASLYDYAITSNHVHLLLEGADKSQISGLMQKVAGEFARHYNRRKRRTNAVWGDSFHATLVEDGDYFFECLLYVELNMVRCGAVPHPGEWEWVGYHEIMGHRQRYRLLDLERLCWRLGCDSLDDARRRIEVGLREKIARGELRRLEYWTQALGVGSRGFLEKFQAHLFSRLETRIDEQPGGICALREEPAPYGNKAPEKNSPNDPSRPQNFENSAAQNDFAR